MANVVLPALATIARRVKDRFVGQTRRAMAVQEQYFQRLLRVQKQTQFGQEYGLGEIRTIDQFRERMPILPYSSYEPYTQRVAQGEQRVLTADPVVYLNLTSGSTGAKKLIPVTRRFQSSLRQANLISIGFLAEALQARGSCFGKLMLTNSVELLGRTEGGIEYGPASVGVLRMGKWLYSHLFAHPFETLMPGESVSRHYLCLLFAARELAVRGMIANFPMLILRTSGYLEKYAEDMIDDIANGTIAQWLTLDPALRQRLEDLWTPDPDRAAQLRSILRQEGRLTPKSVWEQLAFVSTARGGTSDFYFQRFPDYFGDTPVFGGAYAAAEGTLGLYPDVDTDGSVLAIDTGFFEFIPVEQWDLEHPKTLLASEVKVGEHYRILMTNYSGFFRYDIGDVVEVVGFFNQSPLVVFRYRRGGMLSSTTEKTTEFHATRTMQTLQQQFNLSLEDFCITLSDDRIPAHYLVNIELAAGEHLPNPQDFLQAFDRTLQEIHTSYAIKRRDQVPAPRLRLLARGSFSVLRQRQVQRGIPDSQLKFPHLSEDRNFLSGLTVEQEIWMEEE